MRELRFVRRDGQKTAKLMWNETGQTDRQLRNTTLQRPDIV
jgi:hypothetical protein